MKKREEKAFQVTVSLHCTVSVSADSKAHAEEIASELSNEKLLDNCYDFDVFAEELKL